jgi:hypothetical protein
MVTTSKFVWTRQDTLGVAACDCVRCHGLGLEDGNLYSGQPCPCVLKAIFRACYEKFYELATQEKPLARRAVGWARPDEEYMADFLAIAKRELGDDQLRVFRGHFLLGAPWRMCCARFRIDKGYFFHLVYQIEQLVGRALRETQPHALYPIDEYFLAPNAKR